MDDQPVKRRRGTGRCGPSGGLRTAEARPGNHPAIALVLLARKNDAVRRSLDRPTLEAMRDSLAPTGNSRKDV
ncbi:MAG: hypothetical protein ACJ8AW_40430 [Rhodopila sp.]